MKAQLFNWSSGDVYNDFQASLCLVVLFFIWNERWKWWQSYKKKQISSENVLDNFMDDGTFIV